MNVNDMAAAPAPRRPAERADILARRAWSADRQYRFKSARRYSRFVDLMKLVLPLLAFGLVLLMIAWLALHKTPVDLSFRAESTAVTGDTLEMTKPVLSFTDEEARTILVRAERATQTRGTPDLWSLERLIAHVTPPSGATGYKLSADTGRLDSEKQLLDLKGHVVVESSEGYTFKALSAHVDMNEGRVTSEEPVEAQGGATRIVANRFEMWERGDKFRFEGNVRFVSEPSRKAERAQ